MTQIINRIYGSTVSAEAAVAELKSYGYGEIYMVEPTEPVDIDAITAAIMKSNVIKWQAKLFAQDVANGGTLVTVHAQFGTALGATETLDSHHPIAASYVEPSEPRPTWDEGAPVSSMIGLPPLISDPAPISRFLGFPTLTSPSASLSDTIGFPPLASAKASLSSMIGMPLLTSSNASLSGLLGLPLLKR